MNFYMSSENDLIRKYCGQSPEIVNQLKTAEDGKNGSLKLSEQCTDAISNL